MPEWKIIKIKPLCRAVSSDKQSPKCNNSELAVFPLSYAA